MPPSRLFPRGRLRFDMHSDGMVDKATGAVSSRIHVFLYSAQLANCHGSLVESDEMCAPATLTVPSRLLSERMWDALCPVRSWARAAVGRLCVRWGAQAATVVGVRYGAARVDVARRRLLAA